MRGRHSFGHGFDLQEELIYLSLGQLRMAVVNLTAKVNSNPKYENMEVGRINFGI